MKQPTYQIRTFGCQMNKNDSERLARILEQVGFKVAEPDEEVDLVILNTCSVREQAEQRIYGMMQQYADLKRQGSRMLVAVTGCMAGRDKNGELQKRLKHVDLFFPTPEMVHLPRWISELRPEWMIGGDEIEDYLKIRPLRSSDVQAYVSIQTGCQQFCTYCVVPYARGLQKNRPLRDILTELRQIAEQGIRDVTLLGQTVNSYRAPDPEAFHSQNPYQSHFAALLWEANLIPGIERIHWTAPHPLHMDPQVIHALTLPKQVNYLHLPAQSGSNEVLRRMNRKYTREQYMDIINRVKESRPGIALGTDLIVGFPGETEKDFEDTVCLYKDCGFDISYTAQYSPRTGTLAHRLYPDDVPDTEKKRRWEVLQALMEYTALSKNQAFQDRETMVFAERMEGNMLHGTTPELKMIRISGGAGDLVGRLIRVRVNKVMTWMLEGEVV